MAGRARRATRPTSCHFGAALVRCSLVLRADIDRWGDLALHRSGERCRERPEVGRVHRQKTEYPNGRKQGATESSADARDPATGPLRKVTVFNGGVLNRPAPRRSIAVDRAQM